MELIDAHQHCWRLNDLGRDWPPASLAAIHRDFGIADLEPLLLQHGVKSTILVQSMESEDETRSLLELAARTSWIAGVVGWVDLKAVDAPARIARLARDPKLRGLRPMLQSLDDDHWIDDPALAPAVSAMMEAGLAFDALVMPRHLPALIAFARCHRALPIVIDHAAKPPIGGGRLDNWRANLARLAALPNVSCKLSGLVTEAQQTWKATDLQPWFAHILACFGPRRLIWGSDWPVVNLAGGYARWLATTEELLSEMEEVDRSAILGGNARRFYRLPVTTHSA